MCVDCVTKELKAALGDGTGREARVSAADAEHFLSPPTLAAAKRLLGVTTWLKAVVERRPDIFELKAISKKRRGEVLCLVACSDLREAVDAKDHDGRKTRFDSPPATRKPDVVTTPTTTYEQPVRGGKEKSAKSAASLRRARDKDHAVRSAAASTLGRAARAWLLARRLKKTAARQERRGRGRSDTTEVSPDVALEVDELLTSFFNSSGGRSFMAFPTRYTSKERAYAHEQSRLLGLHSETYKNGDGTTEVRVTTTNPLDFVVTDADGASLHDDETGDGLGFGGVFCGSGAAPQPGGGGGGRRMSKAAARKAARSGGGVPSTTVPRAATAPPRRAHTVPANSASISVADNLASNDEERRREGAALDRVLDAAARAGNDESDARMGDGGGGGGGGMAEPDVVAALADLTGLDAEVVEMVVEGAATHDVARATLEEMMCAGEDSHGAGAGIGGIVRGATAENDEEKQLRSALGMSRDEYEQYRLSMSMLADEQEHSQEAKDTPLPPPLPSPLPPSPSQPRSEFAVGFSQHSTQHLEFPEATTMTSGCGGRGERGGRGGRGGRGNRGATGPFLM